MLILLLFLFMKLFFMLFMYYLFNLIFFYIMKVVVMLLPVMIAMAFYTVFESKVLGGMQRSSGPSVVGLYGLLQAFSDGIKLLTKESMMPTHSFVFLFLISPISFFTLALMAWALMPMYHKAVFVDMNMGMFVLFVMSSLSVYGMIFAGWSSNSKYALLGGLSSSAQMISYEVSMGMTLMPVLLFTGSANLSNMVYVQSDQFFFFPLFPSFLLFLMSVLAEVNSMPFDLPEAESELVSGYNVEYSSMGFVFFFLAEYSNMLLMSFLVVMFFFGGWNSVFYLSPLLSFIFKLFVFYFFFIWMSASLPRYSYDQLLVLGWKYMLPSSLLYLCGSVLLILCIY